MQHLCAKDFLVQGRTDLRFEYSAAGRGVSSLVGSAWRPTSVLGELTDKAVNSSLTFFLFHRARRIFFLMSQKENGGCIPAGEACIPAAVRRIPTGTVPLREQREWRHIMKYPPDPKILLRFPRYGPSGPEGYPPAGGRTPPPSAPHPPA